MSSQALIRILTIPPLLALVAFCLFGLLASGEPGTHPAWRVGYAAGIALCLAGCLAAWLLPRRPATRS